MAAALSSRLVIVIPSRYASTRLPGKPLADILGKPMVQHVYERAMEVPGTHAVLVATDDQRVADAVAAFGGRCLMTSPDHPSGTDRLTEVMSKVDGDIFINIQGDEPMVRPGDIAKLAEGMRADPNVQVGTLCHPIPASKSTNPNTVKVVTATNGDALYFSRAPIPYPRDGDGTARYMKHVGVYAYRREVLAAYSRMPQPMIELTEKLEQLRLLAAGIRIRAYEVEPTGPGVDTPECLERVRALMAGKTWEDTRPTLANVRLLITDVDGVLTDGSIFYDETGECMKRFHVRDGLGIRMLEESGIRVAVLSGRDSPTLRKRVADLGISLVRLGAKDKQVECEALMQQAGVQRHQTVYLGDDTIDLPAFAACGLSYAVADAPKYVQSQASGVLSQAGGQGALRELADAILLAQGKEAVFASAQGFASAITRASQ